MSWRVAKSLEVLLGQINALSPNRSKGSDGGIGNAEHATRDSDHNPWVKDKTGQPVVTAYDFTNDPAHGIVSDQIAHALANNRDKRIKFLISNNKICSGEGESHAAWVWRPYPTPPNKNPHDHHFHISVQEVEPLFDGVKPWDLSGVTVTTAAIAKPAVATDTILRQGSKVAAVVTLQALLGFTKSEQDGDFGPKTKAAVVAFQKAHDLVADGVVGSYTWLALRKQGVVAPPPPVPPKTVAAREIHVVAQHGLFGGPGAVGYSLGLDAVIAKAVNEGLRVTSTVLEHYQDDAAYQAALAAHGRGALVVFTGHSLGASDAVAHSNAMVREGKTPALVFVFDPTWNAAAPSVRGKLRAIDCYGTSVLSPLGHDRLEPAEDFAGTLINVPVAQQHQNVDDDPAAQSLFLGELRFLAGKAPSPPDYSKFV